MSHPETVPTPGPVPQDLATLHKALADLRAAHATARRRGVLFSTLIGAMVVGATALIYTRVRANFNDAAVDAALSRHADALRPLVQAEAAAAADELIPVYRAEAAAALERTGPAVGRAALEKLRGLPRELEPAATRHAEAIVQTVYARLAPDLRDAAGTLPEARQRVILDGAVADVGADLRARGERLIDVESARLDRALRRLMAGAPPAPATAEARQRQFLHLVLMLADHHVLYGPDDPGKKPAAPAAPTLAAK